MKLRIREMRKAARYTQSDLAQAVNVTLSTVGNWERGVTIPDIEQICNCAIALGCTPNDLCGWEAEGDAAREWGDPLQADLNAYYEAMAADAQRTLVETARLMSGKNAD